MQVVFFVCFFFQNVQNIASAVRLNQEASVQFNCIYIMFLRMDIVTKLLYKNMDLEVFQLSNSKTRDYMRKELWE